MPRRRVLTDEQLKELLALPAGEPVLIRHWTLSPADLAAVERRRGDPKSAQFRAATLRFPLPWAAAAVGGGFRFWRFALVADQLGVAPAALTAYAARAQTLREQLDALRAAFGFAMFAPQHKRELLTWLLPVVLGTQVNGTWCWRVGVRAVVAAASGPNAGFGVAVETI